MGNATSSSQDEDEDIGGGELGARGEPDLLTAFAQALTESLQQDEASTSGAAALAGQEAEAEPDEGDSEQEFLSCVSEFHLARAEGRTKDMLLWVAAMQETSREAESAAAAGKGATAGCALRHELLQDCEGRAFEAAAAALAALGAGKQAAAQRRGILECCASVGFVMESAAAPDRRGAQDATGPGPGRPAAVPSVKRREKVSTQRGPPPGGGGRGRGMTCLLT